MNSVVSQLILQSINKHAFHSKKKTDLVKSLKVLSHNFRVSWVTGVTSPGELYGVSLEFQGCFYTQLCVCLYCMLDFIAKLIVMQADVALQNEKTS